MKNKKDKIICDILSHGFKKISENEYVFYDSHVNIKYFFYEDHYQIETRERRERGFYLETKKY